MERTRVVVGQEAVDLENRGDRRGRPERPMITLAGCVCGACGQDGPVAARRPDGSAVCRSCYRAPERPCARCGRLAVTYALLLEGPACRSCCGAPLRRCGGCGLDRTVRLRAAAGQPDLCERCAARPLATCAACCQQIRSSPANCPRCGQHQVLLAADPGGSRVCGPCAGHPPEFACAACRSPSDTRALLSSRVGVRNEGRAGRCGFR